MPKAEIEVGSRVVYLAGSPSEDRGNVTRPHEYLACNWYVMWENTKYEQFVHENQLTLHVPGVTDTVLAKLLPYVREHDVNLDPVDLAMLIAGRAYRAARDKND